jgi:hypothetical protein
MCPKQPPDLSEELRTPFTAQELTEENWRAYLHYQECRAVNHFPDDPIVRRDSLIIRQAEDHAEKLHQIRMLPGRKG